MPSSDAGGAGGGVAKVFFTAFFFGGHKFCPSSQQANLHVSPNQRTHPDQVFFCIGPSSRMRMTPPRPFPPFKRVNQSLTPYRCCADGA